MAIDNRNPAASTTHARTDTPQQARPPQSPLEYRSPELHGVDPRSHLPLLPTLPASTTATSAVTTTQAPPLHAAPNSPRSQLRAADEQNSRLLMRAAGYGDLQQV